MITFLVTLGMVAAYCLVGCLVGARVALMFKKRADPNPYSHSGWALGGVLVGIFWPLGMWLLVGTRLLDRALAKDARREADLKQREAAMAERERLIEQARRELERDGLA